MGLNGFDPSENIFARLLTFKYTGLLGLLVSICHLKNLE